MKRLGFVGLGAMGLPMAGRLAGAGFELKVFDLLTERVRPLVELGAVSTASPAEVAEGTDALVLMVANADQAKGVLFGEGGVAGALPEGAAVIVMSTIGPEAVRELADGLAERSLLTLDAPVSGGVARAERGDLLIMAGGPEDLFEKLRPALGTMGSSVVHCGPRVGDGQAVKLVNQLLCGVHIAVAGEALAYAEALGLDPRFVFETIRHGAANSFMLEDRGERMLEAEFVPPRSALDIFVKDMGLVRTAAEERDFETPLASAALALYAAGHDAGLGGEDDAGVIRMFRPRASRG
ncbi:MAG TPA: NAD(P)-dependent oxidoreductase [Rubrobacteraceae bacterium]|nr:NAD(P)-dependent oxidoreductase [Rubrobacteraceae bacterium]